MTGAERAAQFSTPEQKALDILEEAFRQMTGIDVPLEGRCEKLLAFTINALQEARDAALEEAAKICDDLATKWWGEYKRGNGPGRADQHTQGRSDGADECGDAIRSLKSKEPTK